MNIDLLTVESASTAVLEKQTTAGALVDAFYRKIEAEDKAIGGAAGDGAGGGAWPAMRNR